MHLQVQLKGCGTMMRRRGRRRKAHWIWADRQTLTATDTAYPANFSFQNLVQPGRVKYLLDSTFRGRNALTIQTIHLWLDFWWQNPNSVAQALPDAYFFIKKASEDEASTESAVYDPFVQPQVPANITTWGISPADGLDSFMWTHFVRGSGPPNEIQVGVSGSASSLDSGYMNQTSVIVAKPAGSAAQPMVCRTYSMRAEWQPDVIIKSKRRLQGDEGIIIGMFLGQNATTTTNSGTVAHLVWKARVLAS